MLTIKVRHERASGAVVEEIYEAASIKVIRNGDIYEEGIYLDPKLGELPPNAPADASPPLWADQVILFGHDQTQAGIDRKGGKVYVMNGHGETVATYEL